jgi:hypothetical protein
MPALNTSQEEARELPALDDIHAFLLGERHLRGLWFGERYDGVPAFWWRKYLRAAMSRPTPDLGDVDELVERLRKQANWQVAELGTREMLLKAADTIIALRAALDKRD